MRCSWPTANRFRSFPVASVASNRWNSKRADAIGWDHRRCTFPGAAPRGHACQRAKRAPQP